MHSDIDRSRTSKRESTAIEAIQLVLSCESRHEPLRSSSQRQFHRSIDPALTSSTSQSSALAPWLAYSAHPRGEEEGSGSTAYRGVRRRGS
jgi:hypothetical protein